MPQALPPLLACRRRRPAHLPPSRPPTTHAGLVALHSQLESARSLAAAGDFEAGRSGYAAVEAGLRTAAAGPLDPAAAQGWAALLSQLREERELLAAFESECAELEALATEQVQAGGVCDLFQIAAACSLPHRPTCPTQNPHLQSHLQPCPLPQPPPLERSSARTNAGPPTSGAQAFNVDLRSFQCEELPPRPQQHATPPAPQRDPEVWSPADPPGDSGTATPPLGSAYRGRDGSWRERGEAYERLRRESLTPGAGSGGDAHGGVSAGQWERGAAAKPQSIALPCQSCSSCCVGTDDTPPATPARSCAAAAKRGGPFSGVKPRVNTGAKRAPPGGSMDPKCAILDLMLDRYTGADHVSVLGCVAAMAA